MYLYDAAAGLFGARACVPDFRNNRNSSALPRHYFMSIRMTEYRQRSDRLRLKPNDTAYNNGLISITVTHYTEIREYLLYASPAYKRTDDGAR